MTDMLMEPMLSETAGPGLVLDAGVSVDPFPSEEGRPCWRVYDEQVQRSKGKYRAGVYYHGLKENGDSPPTITDTWVCAPLHVKALTSNREDCEHGRLLRYRSVNGNWKQWAMPMSMLAADGSEVRSVLLSEGLDLDRKQRDRLLDYINSQHPKERLKAATTTGWHGDAFVLPDEVLGADDIWYQATERTAPYSKAGTLEGWQKEVAAMATGNDTLTMAICAGFAGVLLDKLNIDGAGLHLFGDSSVGKTSILMTAISVWGGASFRRTWRTTSNGLEGAAKMHTGTLLALDEVGEVNPRDLYESAYALANGHGKTRANVRGEARQAARWRVFVLSTGEVTIGSRMSAGGYEVKAGQTLRLLDVPIVGKYGAFNHLHGFKSGAALSDALRNSAAEHYGYAGRAFVQMLIEQLRSGDLDLSAELEQIHSQFKAKDGQETRAAKVFSVCALAGELATAAHILPWTVGDAVKANLNAFNLWRDHRGANGRNAEDVAIVRAVVDFIDMHGSSRFEDYQGDDKRPVNNRAGFINTDGASTVYMFLPAGLKEATKGYDLAKVNRVLDSAGAFTEKDTGKFAKTKRTPKWGVKKLYVIDPEKLQGGDHE